MSKIKYFILFFIAIFVILSSFLTIYFINIKNSHIQEYLLNVKQTESYLKEFVSKNILVNKFDIIDSTFKTIVNTNNISKINLSFSQNIFSKYALFDLDNHDIQISDVTTDAKFGEIQKLDNNMFIFIPNNNQTKSLVEVKLQIFDNGKALNLLSKLRFKSFYEKEIQYKFKSFLNTFINIDEVLLNRNIIFSYKDKEYAKLDYTLDPTKIYIDIYKEMKNLFVFSVLVVLFIVIILLYFYKQIYKKEVIEPILDINILIDNILVNKFSKLDETKFRIPEINQSLQKLQLVSKKLASVLVELSISKDNLNKKDLIDDLTGLFNHKMFTRDMKKMFVTSNPAFIILSKINELGEFTKEFGNNQANNLIEDFVHIISDTLKKDTRISSSFYRFYGSEFAIILNTDNLDLIKSIMDSITKQVEGLKSKYNIHNVLSNYGITPFDKYASMDLIISSAFDAYKIAYKNKYPTYYMSDNTHLIEKNIELESSVEDVINRNDFSLKYIFDTFTFANNKLIMQEASPIIINSHTFKPIMIGTFISVASKLNLAPQFDKLLIEKVLEHITLLTFEHKIAINLSVESLTNRSFISWLEGILLYNKNARKHLVFSLTSYTAADNLEAFKSFIKMLHRFESRVLLKRFTLADFDIDDIKTLNLDYIRIDKDYIVDIQHDKSKRNRLKHIVLTAQTYDIAVLGDSAKSDEDYKSLEKIGFYATSR